MSIILKIDVTKIDKTRILDQSYVSKDGSPVPKKIYEAELVELKEPKTIKTGDGWELKKTHFIVQSQTKDEKSRRVESVYVGEGLQFIDTKSSPVADVGVPEDIDTSDIPF